MVMMIRRCTGMAFGPFAFAPASELVGRRPVYVSTAFAFVVLNAGTALVPTYQGLIVLRFLAGIAGSTGPTLGSGVIGDMFLPQLRGRAVAVYGLGPLLGPVVGNLISGYIVQASHSFRWLLWTLTIISGAIALMILVFLQETFGPVLLARKRAQLAGEAPRGYITSTVQQCWTFVRPWQWNQSREAKTKFRLAMSRPLRLFGNPVCAIFALYQGFVYGVMFIFLTQHPLLFQDRKQVETSSDSGSSSSPGSHHLAYIYPRSDASDPPGSIFERKDKTGSETADPNLHKLPSYGWSIGNAGLSYIGLGIGFLIAMMLNALVNDWLYRRLVATEGRLTWSLLNPRTKPQQLAQESEARVMAHQVIGSSPRSSIRSPPPPVAQHQGLDVSLHGQPPAYTRTPSADTIRPLPMVNVSVSISTEPLADDVKPTTSPPDDDLKVSPFCEPKSSPPPVPAPAPTPRKGQPEYRLPMCLVGMVILPCGLLLFGWSASAKTHWAVPLLGSLVVGSGLILCFQTILMYLVDAFIPYSASATACSVLTRSILAAVFPLFGEYLYAGLGYGGGSSLLAGVALLGVPVPILMFFYGQQLRTRFAFRDAAS